MSEITRVGADLAKRVIQVHAVDAAGKLVTNRALPRDKFVTWCAQLPAGCLVAMEASSSAHHWARKLVGLGLDARIIPAHLVAPYRLQGKGGKNDANDAAAICEAASRTQMHLQYGCGHHGPIQHDDSLAEGHCCGTDEEVWAAQASAPEHDL